MRLTDNIVMTDLDEEQRQLAELIGLDNYVKLVEVYGGISIYIPKADKLERAERDKNIREEFDGWNYRELAVKYNLTEVRVRSIVSDITREVRARPMDNQLSFADVG